MHIRLHMGMDYGFALIDMDAILWVNMDTIYGSEP